MNHERASERERLKCATEVASIVLASIVVFGIFPSPIFNAFALFVASAASLRLQHRRSFRGDAVVGSFVIIASPPRDILLHFGAAAASPLSLILFSLFSVKSQLRRRRAAVSILRGTAVAAGKT